MLRRTTAIMALLLAIVGASGAFAQTLTFSSAPTGVGAGLQSLDFYVYLSDAQHGGVFVTLTASDSTLVFVARDQVTPGGGTAHQFVPNGLNYAIFVVQGLENVTGLVTVTASAPGFASEQFDVTVEVPQFRVWDLATDMATIDPDDSFLVQTGRLDGTFFTKLKLRTGGPGVTASVTNSDPAVAELVTSTQTGQSVTTSILGGQNSSPAGGVALSGLAAGNTDVAVTIPGFAGQDGGVVAVTMDPATISYFGLPTTVGAGLRSRNGSKEVVLNGTAHGGTTVRVTSLDSSLVLVSPDRTTLGAGFMDIFIPDGVISHPLYLHGLEGVAGIGPIEATAPGFVTANDGVVVEEARTEIRGLVATLDALAPSDPFYVVVGLSSDGSGVNEIQPVRPGSPGLDVALISDNPAAGLLETSTASGETVWLRLEAGSTWTPWSVATGGVAFDGVGAGVATIHPEISGFSPTLGAFQSVTVSQPTLTIPNIGNYTIGSGMQVQSLVRVSAPLHGGTLIHVEVDNPGSVLISDNATTVGNQSADIFIPDGTTAGSFYLQALEGVVESFNLTVSAPGFADTSEVLAVVAPVIDIRRIVYTPTLGFQQTEITAPDEFQIQVGIPSSPVGSIAPQVLRGGSPGIEVTAAVDDPTVGAVLTSLASGAAVTARIEALQSVTPATLAAGGIAFDGLASGPVTVTVSAPGFLPQFYTSQDLNVLPAALITFPMFKTGSGLIGRDAYGQLNGTAHGGTTVHLAVSDPAVALISPDAVTVGQPAIDIVLPDGSDRFYFRVHGLEGATGTVTIDVTAPGIVTSQVDADVVIPYVGMQALPVTKDVNDPPSNLVLRLGAPNGTNSAIVELQARRPGGPPLVATVAVTDAAIAEVLDLAGAAGSRQITLIEGESTTPNSVNLGGLGLRGTGPGIVLVDVSIPGFLAVGTATQEVTVVQNGVALLGFPAALGAGLQSEPLVARLNSSAHGGTTVRLTTANSAAVLISSAATIAGSDTIGIFVPNGQQEVIFYAQAIEGVSGTQFVTAVVNGAVAGQRTLDVVPPAVMITGLPDTLRVADPADLFIVQVGVPTADSASLAVLQAVRAGVPGLSCPVVLDNGAPADLMTQATSADSLNVIIASGAFQSAATIGAGGVSLSPLAQGPVTVTARPAGFTLTVEAARLVYIWDDLSAVGVVPAVTALHGNHPNPFNPMTAIRFSLAQAGPVQLAVHDVRGHLVRTLVATDLAAGPHTIDWNGQDDRGRQQAAGVYLVRLQSPDGVLVHKVALVK